VIKRKKKGNYINDNGKQVCNMVKERSYKYEEEK
jgi:hypothetical protein